MTAPATPHPLMLTPLLAAPVYVLVRVVVGLLLAYVPSAIIVTFVAIMLLLMLPMLLVIDAIMLLFIPLIMLVILPAMAASVTVPDIMLVVLDADIISEGVVIGIDMDVDIDIGPGDVAIVASDDTTILEPISDETAAAEAVFGHGIETP